jgi:hypothetical protein
MTDRAQPRQDEAQQQRLMEQLRAADASKRESAVKKLGALGVHSREIIAALQDIAENDPNPYPRRAARAALTKMGEPPPQMTGDDFTIAPPVGLEYTNRSTKLLHLVIGIVVWFLLNGIGWALAAATGGFSDYGEIFLLLGINALAGLAMLVWVRWIFFGFVAAYLLNIAIATLGRFTSSEAFLGIPFFVAPR